LTNTINFLKDIRNHYSKVGVENFYRSHGHDYENPHFHQIEALLIQNQNKIDYNQVLDLCCGSGEVSRVLSDLGYPNTIGCDPFTAEAYQRSTGKECLLWTFEDLIRGRLQGEYSSVICSFAMHLCPEKQLYPLVYQIFRTTQQLVIITPHKRPMLENLDGIECQYEDYVLTERGKKVRLKSYQKSNFS